jgi:superoxide dismutase, Cu-Zn family
MQFFLAVLAAFFFIISTRAHSTAAEAIVKKAKLIHTDRQEVGEVTATRAPNGVLIVVDLKANPLAIAPGTHAIHIHEVGQCEPPFKSAGAHFNPTSKRHGFLEIQGKHVGDLPNIHVPKNASLTVEFLITQTSLTGEKGSLLDRDGFSIVIHEKADDYKTDPAGDSGDRIACAAFVGDRESKQ